MKNGFRHSRTLLLVLAFVFCGTVFSGAAENPYGPLFDRFSFGVGFSWVDMRTEIRLDSEILGKGTTLNFEDDLDLGSYTAVPTLAFDWQIAKRHRLGVRWQDIDRDSSSQALKEIHWGDEIIPIEAEIYLAFDVTQTFIDYTYYPWVNDRWALGFGGGVRFMKIATTLSWQENQAEAEGSTDAKGSGPLPYLYFDYRLMVADNWRFSAGLGWLYVDINDIDGGQWVGRVGIEYLLGERWAFGGSINLSKIDVDWDGLENDEGEAIYTGSIDMDINDITLFARVRF